MGFPDLDGMDTGSRSSTPTRTPRHSSSGGADENDHRVLHPASVRSQKSKPSSGKSKNFMSPTISAASKAVVPPKKILGERNQSQPFPVSSDDTRSQKHPVFEFRTPPKDLDFHGGSGKPSSPVTQVTPFNELMSKSAEWDDDDCEQKPLVSDSPSQPYDPLTNYLSPRPKFLRYKPHRRREIFLRRERECEDENGCLNANSDRPDFREPQESVVTGNEEEEEETEMGVTGKSTSDPDSPSQENSDSEAMENDGRVQNGDGARVNGEVGKEKKEEEEEDEEDEDMEEEEEQGSCGFKGVLRFFLFAAVLIFSGAYLLPLESSAPFPVENDVLEPVSTKLDFLGQIENYDSDKFIGLGLMDAVGEDFGKEEKVEAEKETLEYSEWLGEEMELPDAKSEDVFAQEVERPADACDMAGNLELVQALESAASFWGPTQYDQNISFELADALNDSGSLNLGAISDESYEGALALELLESMETAADTELSQENKNFHTDLVEDALVDSEPMKLESSSDDRNEENKNFVESDYFPGGAVDNADRYLGPEIQEVYQAMGLAIEDMSSSNINSEARMEMKKELMDIVGRLKTLPIFIFTVALVFAALSLILGFCFQKRRSTKESSLVAKLSPKTTMVENGGNLVPSFVREENIDGAESLINSVPWVHSVKYVPRDTYESRAPTVELLGEFEVGEVSSPLRSCSLKGKTMKAEKSSASVAQDDSFWSKVCSEPIQVQLSHSEFSGMDSPSYGSFTTDTVIVKKQRLEGRDGKATSVATTPVRRSSRIRSRVVSP